MKKLVVLALVVAVATFANANIISVVTDGVGDQGHAGTAADPLAAGETIAVKVIMSFLEHDQAPVTAVRGYATDGLGLSMNISAEGTLGFVQEEIYSTETWSYEWVDAPKLNSGIDVPSAWDYSGNTISKFGGGVSAGAVVAGEGVPADIAWNILVTADGTGDITVDLGIADTASRYFEYWNLGTGEALTEPVTLSDNDLGDLVITAVPEPATLAILGLGGLLIRRKK